MTHNIRQGFMLVAVLSISAFVLLLAFGMVFMAQSSLDISANIKSNTRARYAAEAAIDTASAIVRANPSLAGLPTSGSKTQVPLQDNTVNGYYTINVLSQTGTSTMLQLVGQGKAEHNALHESRALVLVNRQVDPMFSTGLISMRMVLNVGSGQYANGTSIHGNSGFDLRGGQQMLGNPVNNVPVGTITAGLSASVCNQGSGDTGCLKGERTVDVNIPAPNYNSLLGDNFPVCDRVITGDTTLFQQTDFDTLFPAGLTSCVTGNLILNAPIAMNNRRVQVSQSVQFGALGGLTSMGNSILAANNPLPLPVTNTQMLDSKLLVRGGLTYTGVGSLDGQVSLIAQGPITFKGSTRNNVLDKVELAVITESDATFDGASDTRGIFWVGGTYHHNGSTRLYGSVAARGDIELNGAAIVTRVTNVNNGDLPGKYQVQVQSRK